MSADPPACRRIIGEYLGDRYTFVNSELSRLSVAPASNASVIDTCPSVADVSKRYYNTFRAVGGIALSRPRNNIVGELELSWVAPNPYDVAQSGRRRSVDERRIERRQTDRVRRNACF